MYWARFYSGRLQLIFKGMTNKGSLLDDLFDLIRHFILAWMLQLFQSKQGLPIYRETPIVSIVIYREALETHGLEAKVNHSMVSCAR